MNFLIYDRRTEEEKGVFERNGMVYDPVRSQETPITIYRVQLSQGLHLQQGYRAVTYWEHKGSTKRIEVVVNGQGASKARSKVMQEIARMSRTNEDLSNSILSHSRKRHQSSRASPNFGYGGRSIY